MSITLNDSGSYTCIFSPQKLGPKESWWFRISPQGSPEVRKWTGCTWAWKLGKPLQFRWRHYRVPPVSTAFCLHDRWQNWGICSWFSLYFMVVLVFWGFFWFGFFRFCFCFFPFFFFLSFFSFKRVWQNSSEKGCLCFSWLWYPVSGGREEGTEEIPMPACRLRDSWQSTWLASCKGADLQPSLRGQGEDTFLETQRETVWRLLQPRKAVQIAGLQTIWKERLILKENRKTGGRFVFKPVSYLYHPEDLHLLCFKGLSVL